MAIDKVNHQKIIVDKAFVKESDHKKEARSSHYSGRKVSLVTDSKANEVGKKIAFGRTFKANNNEAKAHQVQQNKIKAKVEKDFVCSKHRQAIEAACRKERAIISFRKAGPDTLRRLEQGAGAKGHDILEKTIKEKSLKAAYGNDFESVRARANQLDITGFVGHWTEKNGQTKLAGIYLVSADGLSKDDFFVDDKGHYIINIDLENDNNTALDHLRNVFPDSWQSRLYTGDYDTHDMISMTGRPHSVTSTKEYGERFLEEKRIIDRVNEEVGFCDTARSGELDAYHVVRHGPQVNFNAFMLAEERPAVDKLGGLIGAVAKPDFPIAFCDHKGRWNIVENLQQLENYYQSKGVILKETWRDDGMVQLVEVMVEDNSTSDTGSDSDSGIESDGAGKVGSGVFRIRKFSK